MKKGSTRNEDRDIAICLEYLGGQSRAQLGADNSLTDERIRQILKKYKVELRAERLPKSSVSHRAVRKYAREHPSMHPQKMAVNLGCSIHTIYNATKGIRPKGRTVYVPGKKWITGKRPRKLANGKPKVSVKRPPEPVMVNTSVLADALRDIGWEEKKIEKVLRA